MSLPSGYTEVQYIQGTGTQYLNTDVKPNQNTRLVADFEVLSWPSSQFLGARTGAANTAFNILVANATSGRDDWNTSAINFTSGNARWKIDKNKNTTTINSSVTTHATGTFACPVPIYLFAVNNGGSLMATGCAGAKCYSCQIYDNGSLIRNYIPCINPDGEAGLYDTVNSKFYGNAGTGVFFAGPPRVSLPSGYKQLEYIRSSGTQYVDTEVKADQTYSLEIQFQTSQTTAGGVAVSDTNWRSNGFGIWCNAVAFGNQTYQDVTLNGSDIITAKLGQAGLLVNGETAWTPSAATFNVTQNMTLMALNRSGSISEKLTGKLYYVKITSGSTLIRNFIPCINPNGEAGLYDTVNSKFYGNAGTGVFTAGPEVIWPSNDAIYVKVNGIWRQIDGIKLL